MTVRILTGHVLAVLADLRARARIHDDAPLFNEAAE